MRTLPDGGPVPEDRAPEPHLCRAVSDGRLKVATHPRGEHIGPRMVPTHVAGHLGQPGKRDIGIGVQRRHGHHAPQLKGWR